MMQYLFQSSFLQALGYAIANSLWQIALVWLIYMSVTGLISISAATKYRLAVAAQVTGFVWFLITFQFYYSQYSAAWQQSHSFPQDIQTVISTDTALSSRLIQWMVKGEQLLPYVSMAYLLLMVFPSIMAVAEARFKMVHLFLTGQSTLTRKILKASVC